MSAVLNFRDTCCLFTVATTHWIHCVLHLFLTNCCLSVPDTHSRTNIRAVKCLTSILFLWHRSLINPRHQPQTESERPLHLTKLGPSIRAFCVCVAGRKWPDNTHKRKWRHVVIEYDAICLKSIVEKRWVTVWRRMRRGDLLVWLLFKCNDIYHGWMAYQMWIKLNLKKARARWTVMFLYTGVKCYTVIYGRIFYSYTRFVARCSRGVCVRHYEQINSNSPVSLQCYLSLHHRCNCGSKHPGSHLGAMNQMPG